MLIPPRHSILFALVFALIISLHASEEVGSGGSVNFDDEPSPAHERIMSVDFPNEEIRTVLRNVADMYEINLVLPDTLIGRTSVRLRNVTWRQVFDVVLSPVNYTYEEEGNIVRVVSRDSASGTERFKHMDSANEDSILNGPWWNALVIAFIAITAVCNVCLFAGVLLDSPPGGGRFAPKFIWALAVLVGGVVAVVGYWMIHHSSLRTRRLSGDSRDSNRELQQ